MAEAASAAEGQIVTVVPDLSGLDRRFQYLVPDDLTGSVSLGTIVRVPLRGRRVRAWVVDDVADADVDRSTLRSVIERVSLGPDEQVVGLARYGAWRYCGSLRPFLQAGSPERIVKSLPAAPPPRSSAVNGGDPQAEGSIEQAAQEALSHACALVRLPPSASRLSLIEAVLARTGNDVLVLTPELKDARTLERLLRRRGWPVALLPDQWPQAARGGSVVVGTRSAVLAPIGKLDAIVVIDGHAESYTSQRVPSWNAVVLAKQRASMARVPCVIASPCPSVELLTLGDLVSMESSRERSGWPVVEVVDRREDDPRTGLYSERLASAIRTAHRDDPDRPVVCVFNRVGRTRLLACAFCGELVRCENCGGGLSQLSSRPTDGPDELVCPQCGTHRPVVCASCGSSRLKALRVGVSRVKEEVAALTGLVVEEVSSANDDSFSTNASTPVVVGTEAALHRLRTASLVVFLDFDQHLLAPRFRAGEQCLALLARAGRLVGGRDGASISSSFARRVMLQTRLPTHEVIVAATAGDPAMYTDAERLRRESLRLPPRVATAAISGEGAAALCSALQRAGTGIEVAEMNSGHFVVRASTHQELCDAYGQVRNAQERVRVEVDPLDL